MELVEPNPPIQIPRMNELKDKLSDAFFEVINDKKHILVEKIKGVIVVMLSQEDTLPKMKNSL